MSSTARAEGEAAHCQLAARRIARSIARVFGDSLAAAGLTESQYLLLTQLRGGPLRATDLADRVEVQPSTLSRNLRPLLRAGLVEWTASMDARSRPLELKDRVLRRQEEGWTQCESAALALRAILGKERIAALHVLAEDVHRLLDRHAGPRRARERRGIPATGIISVRTA